MRETVGKEPVLPVQLVQPALEREAFRELANQLGRNYPYGGLRGPLVRAGVVLGGGGAYDLYVPQCRSRARGGDRLLQVGQRDAGQDAHHRGDHDHLGQGEAAPPPLDSERHPAGRQGANPRTRRALSRSRLSMESDEIQLTETRSVTPLSR